MTRKKFKLTDETITWMGGAIGHSIDMLPGELHEAAFRRYCDQKGLTFIAQIGGAA